jgi:hypothetical protein
MAPTNATSPHTVCMMGFHRSGTSLTARVVNLLGIPLGDESELLEATETDNPRGYWEPRWMNDLNDELLATFGTQWWEPFSAPLGWEQSDTVAALRARAQQLVATKLGETTARAVKDPRLSLTFPFWRPLLGDVSCLICVRNPIDAVGSLQRRPEPTLSVRAWGGLWLEYTARALHATRGLRRMLVFFEDYFDDPVTAVTRIASFLGVADDELVERAAAEISDELRRHLTPPAELAADPGVPAATRMVYLALRAGNDASEELADAIERAAPDLWWTSRIAAAYEHTADELAATRTELIGHLAELDGRAAQVRELEAHRRDLDQQLAQARDETAVVRAELQRLRTSRSWRLTAPLRRTAQRARGRARRT